ncbi:MAG: radical SAM protein [bacterium]
MKIVFVYPAFGSLAIEYLAAVAKGGGHEVELVLDPRLFNDSFLTIAPLARIFSMERAVVREVRSHAPDLVAFSVVTSDFPWFRRIGGSVRAAVGAPVVAGNIHVTSVPEEVLKLGFVDAVVRGEGERAFAGLLDSLAEGGIDASLCNLGVRENGGVRLNPLFPLIEDLDTLPFPDKSVYGKTPILPRDVYTIMASRGCPFRCSFCNNSLTKRLYGAAGFVRTRSVDNVIEELDIANRTYRPKYVNFYDEVFGVGGGWLAKFAEKYPSRVSIPYIACTNPNVVDGDYARLLRESGCTKVDLGVQTINQDKRRDIYHRTESTEKVREAISVLKGNGIFVAAENITNFPTETEADLVEMAKFYNETRPDVLKVFWLRYFPGTEIVDIALRLGALTPADAAKINSGEFSGSITLDDSSPSLHRKFYLFFALTQILPRGWIDFMIRRRLYRFLPSMFLPGAAYTATRLLMRKPPGVEIMLRQHMKRYRHYLGRLFLTGFGMRVWERGRSTRT